MTRDKSREIDIVTRLKSIVGVVDVFTRGRGMSLRTDSD